MPRQKVIIMGAAGRDFHNFNMVYKDNEAFEVIAFTATQIPNIEGRLYPAELAGVLYPTGIPIYPETDLDTLIEQQGINQVVFSYSDVPYDYVMHKSAQVMAAGADFRLLGGRATMLQSTKPVIAICSVRTGCGKSQTTRAVAEILREHERKIVVVRHPMPYGNLVKQKVQRFADLSDLEKHKCTIEEREEYEPHLISGHLVYAGVDYAAILHQAEQEADVIVWDGGNNDLPFFRPDLHIVVVDPHRAGHEVSYFPGEANLRMADVVVVNKVNTANVEGINVVLKNVRMLAPTATVLKANSLIKVEDASSIEGKHVLVIEDGPTLTHGDMAYGAGVIAANEHNAAHLVDPRPYAIGSIKATFEKYPSIGPLIPAMGYGAGQIEDLQATIKATPCDLVLVATPIDLKQLIEIEQPSQRVTYELTIPDRPDLRDLLDDWLSAR